jgi:hypothetical protein
MTSEPDNEAPWGEEQWERFMKESDVRSARYGELLETLMDHPERDEIIAREMGWDRDDEVDDEAEDDWRAELNEAMNDPLTDEELEEYRRERGEVEDVPAYARSFAWASRVFHSLRPEFESPLDEMSDVDELFIEALDCRVVAAKIAGGHGMGYDEDSLCGNIVCCKRSLEAADNSLRALAELAELRPELRETIAPLLEEGRQVRQLVVDRIEELRSQVWWE